jgi:hypothetical protein
MLDVCNSGMKSPPERRWWWWWPDLWLFYMRNLCRSSWYPGRGLSMVPPGCEAVPILSWHSVRFARARLCGGWGQGITDTQMCIAWSRITLSFSPLMYLVSNSDFVCHGIFDNTWHCFYCDPFLLKAHEDHLLGILEHLDRTLLTAVWL